ncbi:hypothetical protein EAG_05391 [Camponotus floridanus]|uniref:Uncharacterized protein n=1 Tax=Camponotus floridanus TaxID=104421 RepID=E2A5X3_CAMFO|nr:hypothetical protein EAG_05391 [Camponotus floridanus]
MYLTEPSSQLASHSNDRFTTAVQSVGLALKPVSLCDDYSLPVDFVNKRRPASAAAATSTVQWTLPSPTVENAEVEVVEQYSDPRDSKSKAYIEPGAESSLPTIYSRANRNYCRPYTGNFIP